MKGSPQTSFNSGTPVPVTHASSGSNESSVDTAATVETPLDLTKSGEIEDQQKGNHVASRARSRKGKALKLDALCLRLQEKMTSETKDKAEPSTAIASDGSSPQPVDEMRRNQYPLPAESGEALSDNNHLKLNVESVDNNNMECER